MPVEFRHFRVGHVAVLEVECKRLAVHGTAGLFAVFKRVLAGFERADGAEFGLPAVTLVFHHVFQERGRFQREKAGGRAHLDALADALQVIFRAFDDVHDAFCGVETLRDDGPAEGGSLVRHPFARRGQDSGERGDDGPARF